MASSFTPEQIAQILEEFFKTVGTRQYIGARYVPIFGRKGESSILWDNSNSYEPLTIVLDGDGNSFTSRQFVPAGTLLTDELFWAQTGNFNGQVEQYRQEVNQFDARITANADGLATLGTDVTNMKSVLPYGEFSSENTVKEYVDLNIESTENKISEVENLATLPNVFPCPSDSLTAIGQLSAIDGYIFQGGFDDGAYYYAAYYASNVANTFLGKFNRYSYELINSYDFGTHIHANGVAKDPYTGNIIVSGNSDGKIYLINPNTMSLAKTIETNHYYIQSVAINGNYACASLVNSDSLMMFDRHSGLMFNHMYSCYGFTHPYSSGVTGRQCVNTFRTGFMRLHSNARTADGHTKHFLVALTENGCYRFALTMPWINVEFEGFTYSQSDLSFVLHDSAGKVYKLDASSVLATMRDFSDLEIASMAKGWVAPSLSYMVQNGWIVTPRANFNLMLYVPINRRHLYGFGNTPWYIIPNSNVFPVRCLTTLNGFRAVQTIAHKYEFDYQYNYNTTANVFYLSAIHVYSTSNETQYDLTISMNELSDLETLATKIYDFFQTLPDQTGITAQVSTTNPIGVVGFGQYPYSTNESANLDLG